MMGRDRIDEKAFSSRNFFEFHRLDDLLVGAPLYTVRKDNRIIPEAGRVDVFYQTRQVGFL